MRTFLIAGRVVIWSALIAISLPIIWQLTTGGSTLEVTGVSMRPTYERGDVLFVSRVHDPTASFWEEGKIVVVVFDPNTPNENRYVHRVESITDDGRAVLKGDGNSEVDVSPVTLDQVYGIPAAALQAPWAGIYMFTQSLSGRLVIFGLGIALLVVIEFLGHQLKHRQNGDALPDEA